MVEEKVKFHEPSKLRNSFEVMKNMYQCKQNNLGAMTSGSMKTCQNPESISLRVICQFTASTKSRKPEAEI